MGNNCCKEQEELNPHSRKMMRAISKNSKFNTSDNSQPQEQIFIQVYDIEKEVGKEIEINLRFLKLNGLSQLNMNNTLYLCGSALLDETSGSTFIQIDPMKSPTSVKYYIHSTHPHFYPSMAQVKKEFILLIGGQSNVKCEMFHLKTLRWKDLPELPEERYNCNIISDDINNNIYIFGGYNNKSNRVCTSVLKLNLKPPIKWDTIVILSNYTTLLSRCYSCVVRVDKNTVLIIGGKTNEKDQCDDIIDCDFTKNPVPYKSLLSLEKTSKFTDIKYASEYGDYFYLFDDDASIHKISRDCQTSSVLSFFTMNGNEEQEKL